MSNAVVSVYKIDKASLVMDLENRDYELEGLDSEALVNTIMASENDDLELPYTGKFEELNSEIDIDALNQLSAEHSIGVNVFELNPQYKLFYGDIQTTDHWGPFFGRVANDNSRFHNLQNRQNSFLLFMIIEEDIYVVTSGLAYYQISRYIDEYFGVTVLSHFINATDTEIRSLQDNSLYGRVLASDRLFGNNFTITNEDSFGKVYKKILASVNPTQLHQELPFLFSASNKNSRNCLGKSHFTIYKAISPTEAALLICKLHEIYHRGMNSNLKIANIRVLKTSRAIDKHKITKLSSVVLNDFANTILGQNLSEDYLVLHKDVNKFYSAHSYSINIGPGGRTIFSTQNVNDITIENILYHLCQDQHFKNSITRAQGLPSNKKEEQYLNTFKRVRLSLHNQNYPNTIEEPLLKMIQCEASMSSQTFYNLNDRWFSFDSSLPSQIDTELKEMLSTIQNQNILRRRWSQNDNEHTYIEKYLSSQNFYPIHRIISNPLNIELADLIHVDLSGHLTLIHVKHEFNNKIRELTSQVITSAQMLNDDIKTNNSSWLKALYNNVKTHSGTSSYFTGLKTKLLNQFQNESQFVNAFKNNNITFCLAFTGHSNNRSISTSPSSYRSLIAKMSLLAAERQYGNIKDRRWDLKTCQIQRS